MILYLLLVLAAFILSIFLELWTVPTIQQENLAVIVLVSDDSSESLVKSSNSLVKVIITPTDVLQLWNILRLLCQINIVKHLFVHERLVNVWIWNSNKNDSPAKAVREVNTLASLSPADTVKHSFVALLNMLFVLIYRFSCTFCLEKLLLPRFNLIINMMKIRFLFFFKIIFNIVFHDIVGEDHKNSTRYILRYGGNRFHHRQIMSFSGESPL